jgi:hypothetical protein
MIRLIMGHKDVTFLGTEEVDIGTTQDELWDKTRSFFGILEGDFSTYKKVIT